MYKVDTHIHSEHSFVGDESVSVANIQKVGTELGLDAVGIADHSMKEEHWESLQKVKTDIAALPNDSSLSRVLFGIEVCEVAPDGTVLLTEEKYKEFGFDFTIGGVHDIHVPKGSSIEDLAQRQHKHMLMFMNNPLIDILVHPWWLWKKQLMEAEIEFPQNMNFIPKDLTAELAHESKRTKTYIEVCAMSSLVNKGVSDQFRADNREYYKFLYKEGAYFAVGSDAHKAHEMETVNVVYDFLKEIDVDETRMWKPKN